MTIVPIKSKKDYKQALRYIEEHFHAPRNSEQESTVEVLAVLVEKYEEEHFPIDAPTPVEAIKFRMDQLGLTNADLAIVIGTRGRVSEILNGKRQISVKIMKTLHRKLHIPAESLLSEA